MERYRIPKIKDSKGLIAPVVNSFMTVYAKAVEGIKKLHIPKLRSGRGYASLGKRPIR